MQMNEEGQQQQLRGPWNQWKKNETHAPQGRMGTTLQISKDQSYVVNIVISNPKLQGSSSMDSKKGEDCLDCNEQRCSLKRHRIKLGGESS